ncbi:MAG: glycosyltransferase family 9 protein [Chitinispirillaceae bacterium]|jgi:ADP-heptose:LPS heptosyltransferase
MSILIYHAGALGDFITTIPALRFWKNKNRSERFFLLGKSSIGEFAKDIGLIDEMLDVDSARSAPLFSDDFSSQAGELLAPFKTAILFAAPGSPIISTIRQSTIQSLYWQPSFPATDSRIHLSDYHLSLFTDPQSLGPEAKQPRIAPSAASIKKTLDILPENCSPVGLHPGSGSRKKNWPLERYLLLADKIRKKGISVLWLLGPAEAGFNVPPNDIIVSNRPFALCAALLSRCCAFVGNDSGFAHLAAGVGCRTIALFGPSDPIVWSPRGRDVCVIKSSNPCMTAITVEEVFNEIRI